MDDIERLVQRCVSVLPLGSAELGGEYGYDCLPLCVIDAVWSIGVRYGGVKNVVARYSAHYALEHDENRHEHSVAELTLAMEEKGVAWFAEEVFRNAQRTSTRGGILKAEAVYRFAAILKRHGMYTIQDIPKIDWYENLRNEIQRPYAQEILSIPGQRSGISLSYFYMLTGSSGLVKPDRMVYGFLRETLNRQVSDADAQHLLSYASQRLNSDFPELTPRLLDHQIWKYQSGRISSS